MKEIIYRKMPNVTIYYNGDSQIRLRKGVWNFEEVTIDLSVVSETLGNEIKNIFSAIDRNENYLLSSNNKTYQLTEDEYKSIVSMLDELKSKRYLCDNETNKVDILLQNIIGGYTDKKFNFYQSSSFSPILLICDNTIVMESIIRQGEAMTIPVKPITNYMLEELLSLDLSNTEPVISYEKLSIIVNALDIYPTFLIVLEKPNMKLLRAFNRALKEMNKSATLIMLDGPFITLTTVKLPETGCFECLENRNLARLEEMSVYQNFVSQSKFEIKDFTFVTPILNTFASLGLQEMLLILAIGKSKFVGRVMSIYLPLLEVQIQDLLRIPVCPTCGMLSTAEFEEMYTSTQNIVGKLVKKVILTKNT